MTTTRRAFLTGATAGLGLLVVPGTAMAAPATGLTKTKAVAMAQAVLASRLGILGEPTAGGSRSASEAVQTVGTKAAITNEAIAEEKIQTRRASLSQYGLTFAGSTTTIDSSLSTLDFRSSTEAVLSATCEARLFYAPGQRAPEFSGERVTRRIRFVKSGSDWKVDQVEEVTGFNASWFDPTAISSADMDAARGTYPVERSPKGPDVTINSVSTANSYANRWWNSRNGAYLGQANDCQNFVSQILSAGGWSRLSNWYHYKQNNVWYYSRQWVQVVGHFEAFNGSRYNNVGMNSTLGGDVMVYRAATSNSLTHSMFIQRVQSGPSGGERYLAGHSNDRINHPFSQVVAAEQGATFYGCSNLVF